MLLLHKVTHSQFPQLANNSMIFKQLPTMISDLNKLGIALKSLDAMKIGTVGVDAANIEAYRTALKGLSVEQSVFALASKGATEEQIRQILVTDQAKLKDVEAAMAKAGLTTATKALNAEELIALATKKGISAERAKEIASALGLIATEKGQVVSKKQLTVATLQQVGATDAEITAILGLNAAETANIGITNVLTASFAKLWAVITAHPIGAILTAIGVVAVSAVAAYNKWGDTLENTKEKLSDLKSECQEIVSDLQAVNSELETTQQRLEELEGKDTLTFTEKEEYDNLVKINNELQRKIDLLELEEKNKRKEQNKTFVSAMEKDTEDPFEHEVNPDGKKPAGQYSISDEYLTSETGYIEAQFEIRDQLLEDLANAETEKEKERIQKRIDEIDKYLNDKNDEWKNVSDGIDYIENPTTEDDKAVNEWLDYIADFQDRMAIAMSKDDASSNAQYKTNTFNRVVDNWQFDETVQGLQDLGKEGKVTAEMLDDPKYDDFINKLVFLGVIDSADNLEDVALAFNSVATSAENAADSASKYTDETDIQFSDIFALKDSEGKLNELGKINEEIDKFQSAYKGLKEAMDSYNETGTFTLDQVQEIISYGGDYLKYLMDENGNLQLNEEALNKVAIARINEMRAKALSNLMDNLDKITTEEQALNYLETQLLNTATAYDALTASRIKTWSENALENGISQETINKVIKSFKNQASAINEMFNNISLDSIYKSSSSSAKSATKDAEQATKEYIDSYMTYMEKSLESGRINYQTYARDVAKFLKDMYGQGKIAAKDYHDYTKQMLEVQKNVYDKALSAITRRLEKESEYYQGLIDEINKKNDSLEKQKDDYDSILSIIEKVYDKEIEALQEQQKAIDEKIDVLRDANDEEERGIALANARYALEKAQQQRTRLVYTEGEGFIYKQDNEAIREARKELKDVELENTISQLEKEKEALDEDIENLEKYKDLWSEIPDLHQQAVNEKLAIDMFGADYEKVILQSREQAINEFANKYISIQQQVDDNNSLIESYEEKKEYYDKLREQWNDLTDVYEQSVEGQYAAQILGADWESQILSGRIDTLNNFAKTYFDIQEAIIEEAWRSSNEQVKAAQEAAKKADGNIGDASKKEEYSALGFKKTLDLDNVTLTSKFKESLQQKTNNVNKYGASAAVGSKINNINNNANILDEYYKKLKRGSKYASGTKNAKKGLNLVGEEGTETFVDNDGNVSLVTEPTLIPMKGGETVIKASETEKILTGIDNLVPLNWDEMWNKIKISPQAMPKFDLNIPDYSKMLSNAKSQDVSITQHIELTLPNVTNTSGAENVIETIRKLPLDALQYVNRR